MPYRWTAILGLTCLLLATTVALAATARGAAPRDHDPAPCDPVASREVSPRVTGPGGTVRVRVAFNYHCREQHRPIHFFLVVENTAKTAPDNRTGRQLMGHIREGLTNFVEEMDYDQGSQGGLILYHSNVSVNTALTGGAGGQRELINAIDRFGTTSSQTARTAGEAIVKATELLAAAPALTDSLKVILLLDAGASLDKGDVDPLTACAAAKAAGIHMGVFALETAGDRLKPCAEETSFWATSRDNGEDIPDKLQQVGMGLAHGLQIERLGLDESLGPQFKYVEGSASPIEPEVFVNELSWQIMPPPPPGGHVITFSAQVKDGVEGEIAPLSATTQLVLFYFGGSFLTLPLDNPEVCVYTNRNPRFCDRFLTTLTPPAPTATPTPTLPPSPSPPPDTPTVPPIAGTPTPTASPTPDVTPGHRPLYLPAALKDAAWP